MSFSLDWAALDRYRFARKAIRHMDFLHLMLGRFRPSHKPPEEDCMSTEFNDLKAAITHLIAVFTVANSAKVAQIETLTLQVQALTEKVSQLEATIAAGNPPPDPASAEIVAVTEEVKAAADALGPLDMHPAFAG